MKILNALEKMLIAARNCPVDHVVAVTKLVHSLVMLLLALGLLRVLLILVV